ncbi:hypothetical protein GOBAR_AA14840 [Gossypium barbadense]|uniref:Uncharacterized protein n=1 Tax=Gossypium barbadense TaxID=3634 RepID=A0A2P5XR57_GOSBA|nr:hypothetical protein GOBAR_AA14840 [Gossypium barbadense]
MTFNIKTNTIEVTNRGKNRMAEALAKEGVWGDLIALGKNPNKASCFASMPKLVSIMEPEKVDDLIFLEVGSSRFPIRVVEQGLSKVEYASQSLTGNNGGDGKNIEQGRADSVMSEFESVLGLRSDWLKYSHRMRFNYWFGLVEI